MTEISFRWIVDTDTLLELRPAWQALLKQSKVSSAFQTPEFVQSVLHAKPTLPLRVLSLWQHDTLVGLGLWQARKVFGLPGLSVIGADGALRLTPEYSDTLYAAHADTELLLAATAKALKARRDWLIFHAPDQLDGSAFAGLSTRFSHDQAREGLRYLIALDAQEDPLFRFDNKQQARFRRNLRRADRLGGTRLVRLQGNEALETLKALHAERWQGDNIYAISGFADTHKQWLHSEHTWVWGLEVEGTIQAAIQVIRHANTLCYYQSGFRQTHANHLSPLSLLHLLVMRIAVHQGIEHYDLMRGDADSYKTDYPAAAEVMSDHYLFRFAWLKSLWRLKNTLRAAMKRKKRQPSSRATPEQTKSSK